MSSQYLEFRELKGNTAPSTVAGKKIAKANFNKFLVIMLWRTFVIQVCYGGMRHFGRLGDLGPSSDLDYPDSVDLWVGLWVGF